MRKVALNLLALVVLTLLPACRPPRVYTPPPPPEVTLAEYINQQVSRDPALKVLFEGAEQASVAFHMASDTPAEQLYEGSEQYRELQKAIDAAHDAYRRYQSWGKTMQSSSLSPSGIRLTSTLKNLVPIVGTHVLVRASVGPFYSSTPTVVIQSIESSRGRAIITFDADMNPAVTPEFRVYLVGDRVDITGVARKRIKRGDADGPAPMAAPVPMAPPLPIAAPTRSADASGLKDLPMVTTPTPAPVAPTPPSVGCMKDTDCKGERICENGMCVNPIVR